VGNGMGLRLSDPEAVRTALTAEWIVAVGLHADDAVADVEALLSDGVANGAFSFLRQDAATNNGDGSAANELSPLRDLPAFHRDATEHERDLHTGSTRRAADVLAEALGIDPEVARRAPRSADTGLEDARAMLRVVLPALLERLPDEARGLDHVDTDDLIDFFASWINARGQLPALRLGDEPYGVLPVTRLQDLEALPDDDDTDRDLQTFLRDYAARVGPWLARRADEHVSVIEPGDVDAATALEDALKVAAVSRRIDVDAGDTGDTLPVGCPYVLHDDHDPADYLERLRTTPLDELPDPTADDRTTPLLYRLARRAASRRIGRLGQLIQLEASPAVSGRVDAVLERLGDRDLHVEPGMRERIRPVTDVRDDAAPEPDDEGGPTFPRISSRLTEAARRRGREFHAVLDESAALGSLTAVQSSSIATLAQREELTGFDAGVGARLRWFTRGFGEALAHLRSVAARPDGAVQLETLLFETVDLVQHRVDAWAAGLAYRRLAARRRRAELEGLRGGYYGLIGRIRPTSATAATDGYLQAPSPEQATSAAVLRSAHLRFREEGAFDVDLSSSRVRHAVGLYALVQRGLSLEEILGLSGERWLHDRRLDRLIPVLRRAYPLRDPDDGDDVRIRLFDGRRFLETPLDDVASGDDRAHLEALQATLGDDLDALSDLVMAEAVHQRVQGNADAAHAWLQVLSGDAGPGEPSFSRTHRRGHASSHAVLLLVPGRDPAADGTPRELAEPSLAAAVAEALPDLHTHRVTVVVHPTDELPGGEVDLSLDDDLGLTAWDLVVGGRDELRLRATATLLRRWQADGELQAMLGAAPGSLRALAAARITEVRVDEAAGGLGSVLDDATAIRRAVSSGRALQVSDLHAAAPADEALPETAVIERLTGATEALRRRASALRDHLDALHDRLEARLDAALVHARNLRRLQDAAASPGDIADASALLRSAAGPLHDALLAASRTAEPRALLMTASTGLRDDPDTFEEDGTAVLDHLAEERRRLRDALAEVPARPATASEARRGVRRLVETLRGTLDGDALPVLVPIESRDGTRPVLESAPSARARLDAWVTARAGVQRAVACAEATGLTCFAVGEAATTDDRDLPDGRDPTVSPRSRFHGTVLSPVADPAAHGALAGVVIDEWAESTPSREQLTGLAINYDTPSNEAPNALLLCEPPAADHRSWSVERAAGMVVETIRWMKVRALTTEVAAPTGPLLAGCNRLVGHGTGDDTTPRVPWQEVRYELLPVGDAQFVLAEGVEPQLLNEALTRRSR
jgi:hypothetical protein